MRLCELSNVSRALYGGVLVLCSRYTSRCVWMCAGSVAPEPGQPLCRDGYACILYMFSVKGQPRTRAKGTPAPRTRGREGRLETCNPLDPTRADTPNVPPTATALRAPMHHANDER